MQRLSFLIVMLIYYVVNLSNAKMSFKSIKQCEEKDYSHSFNITTYFENEQQFMDANSAFKIPLSNELKAILHVDLILGGQEIKILSITERNGCGCVHKYLGEFVYDIERASGLTPGLCPIPKGKYRISHFLINLNKMTIRGFPFGILQFVLAMIDKTDAVVSCLKGELDNRN